MIITKENLPEVRAMLLGSFRTFTQVFFKKRTGKEFIISNPVGRESHCVTIFRELTDVFYGKTQRLIINIPPGHGKSTFLVYFIAWSMAHFPDSNFLYISYSQELAAKHTYEIKQIMNMPEYELIFGVTIKRDSSAKDNFKTNFGGSVMAFGSSGSITGQDAGLPGLSRFGGGIIIDDPHKPDEIHSKSICEGVIRNYYETIQPRARGINTPYIFIGQRLSQKDLADNLIRGEEGYEWRKVILPAIDVVGNVLDDSRKTKEQLLIMKERNPYVFFSQYQQDPTPAGDGLFKREWFPILDDEPNILATFITADSAESIEQYADYTVFSFWGLYKIKYMDVEIGEWALHLLNCKQFKCEPKDLERHFMSFWFDAMQCKVKPCLAAIEKKSTGATLCSVLSQVQGLRLIEIERLAKSGNKSSRFFSLQPAIASKLISLPANAPFNEQFLSHMESITLNCAQAHDDIADTVYDAYKLALVDKAIPIMHNQVNSVLDDVVTNIASHYKNIRQIRQKSLWQR